MALDLKAGPAGFPPARLVLKPTESESKDYFLNKGYTMSDYENTIHNEIVEPEAEQQVDMEVDDKGSTSSSKSADRFNKQCPFCQCEVQLRVMFNHIRKKHPYQFMMCMDVFDEQQIKEIISCGSAFPFSFSLKNDFDEEEETRIYGCLGCNNTFTHELRANGHCGKAKCKLNHIKGIKALIKQNEDDKIANKKKKKNKPVRSVEKLIQDITLWIRRYLHVSECARLLNQDYQDQKIKSPNDIHSGMDIQITDYDPMDFKIPRSLKREQYEALETTWCKRAFTLEDSYDKLRDHLFNFSMFGGDKYYCWNRDAPTRIFIGLTNHEDIGEEKYPPLS